MMSLADAFRLEGEENGIKRGLETALLKLLHARFGEVPTSTRARIDAADKAQLDAWFDRALAARSLDEVLADG